MLNSITLMGRFTAKPELHTTQNGNNVCNFTLACPRDFGGEDKGTDFIDCLAWRGTADFVSKYFDKGSLAVVAGRLQVRNWTDNNNNKRRSTEVVVTSIYFGGTKHGQDGEPKVEWTEEEDDGELPF